MKERPDEMCLHDAQNTNHDIDNDYDWQLIRSLFFSFGATAPFGPWPWPTSMKLSVSLRFYRS
jgi:hypothetical protein